MRKDVFARFMKACIGTTSPTCTATIPRSSGTTPNSPACPKPGTSARDDGLFLHGALVEPDAIHGMDLLLAEAVTLKFIATPLTKEQVAELVRLQK